MRKAIGATSKRATPRKKGPAKLRAARKVAEASGVAEPRAAVSYLSGLEERLRDSTYAADYVRAAADEGCEAFVVALGDVIRAHRFSNVSARTALNREHLYRAFSKNGNPSIETVWSVMEAIGLHLSVETSDAIEFSNRTVRSNPYAERIAKEGITVQIGRGRPKKVRDPLL